MAETESYSEAIAELQTIVAKIEANAVSMDELVESVKTGARLIAQCKQQLRTVEDEVKKALEAVQEDVAREESQSTITVVETRTITVADPPPTPAPVARTLSLSDDDDPFA